MEKMAAATRKCGDVTPAEQIMELFEREPLTMSPWKIVQFFENAHNISEDYLDQSFDQLATVLPNFEKDNQNMVDLLEKAALLTVPMFRTMPIMTLLTMIREASSTSAIFSLVPDFPKLPAKNLADHIFPDPSMTPEEKRSAFEQIAKNTTNTLGHLMSWRNDAVNFMQETDDFMEKYKGDLKDEQNKHVKTLHSRTKATIVQIDHKIAEKKIRSAQELAEFEKFYKVVVKEPKWAGLEPKAVRGMIQTLYDDSDDLMRSMIARMADSEEKEDEEESQNSGTRGRKRAASPENSSEATAVVDHSDKPMNGGEMLKIRAKNKKIANI